MVATKPVSPRLDTSHAHAQGLVGLFLFHEGSGSVVSDIAGAGATASLDAKVAWASGDSGPMLRVVEGNVPASQWAVFSADSRWNLGAGPGSVIARVRFAAFPGNSRVVCFGNNAAWQLYRRNTKWAAHSFGAGAEQEANLVLELDTWYTLGYSFDPAAASGTIEFYADGAFLNGITGTAPAVSNDGLVLRVGGNAAGANDVLVGDLDWVRVYDVALSAAIHGAVHDDPLADIYPNAGVYGCRGRGRAMLRR